ncbi:MAG TPA: hypothetical protein VEW03_10365 [Longimicrobiaceae bacterium]|nr:hypothetical protein [Longimicrobiaceae bacterium]
MSAQAPRSLRRAYEEWVEERVEDFKDSIPRGEILAIADRVVEELQTTGAGQYQLTELLLCDAVDRHLVRMLKLPGYRAWCAQRRRAAPPEKHAGVIPFRDIAGAPRPAGEGKSPVACVV